ncbi:MAG: DUF2304 domain-containing protein [Rhodocyclaceae bacterium]|nr:DUF2304 domain-containing protein [Rhodocyclaceae bacterium]
MISYQWASAGIGIIIAGIILMLVMRDRLHSRYALWWLPVAVIICVLGISPDINNAIGSALGISYPPVLPLIVASVLMIVKILLMDLNASRMERVLQRLVQRIAILESDSDERRDRRRVVD